MTDVQTIEHDDDETPQQPVVESQAVQEPVDAGDAIRQARALIPVGKSGAMPMNFAQQVDFAKTMAQARSSLPPHLSGNAGDCLAIIDIASRANLSPYMVGNMTYVEPKSKRLSFMSQLYHAFLSQSGMLIGDLEVTYEGEGEDRTCTVAGRLRSDGKIRTHTSPPLAKVRPPKNSEGVTKGSPLWTKKPDVQLFYDTSRDWTRIFCPTATLGIFAPEEFEETPIGPDNAKDVTGLTQRIAGADKSGGEGFRDGHAASELAQVAPGGGKIIDADPAPGKAADRPADGATAASGDRPATKAAGKPNARTTAARKPAEPARTTTLTKEKPASKAAANAAADRAEARSKATAAPEAPKARTALKTAADYVAYARANIDAAKSHDEATATYDDDRALRDELKIPIKDRNELASRIDNKFGA